MKAIKFLTRCCLILASFFMGYDDHNSFDKNVKLPERFDNGKALVAHLDWLFIQLANKDTNDSEYMESATLINEKIKKTMERVKLPERLLEVNKSYLVKKHDFLFALSEDGQLWVFSWDSRMGSITGKIKNIALYASQGKIIPTSLYGDALYFNQIHTIKNGKRPSLYMLHGKGKSTNDHNFYRLNAYAIKKDGLEYAKIFPNNASSLNSSNLDQKSPLDFSIEMDGPLILKPELWGSTIVYSPWSLINTFKDKYVLRQGINLNILWVKMISYPKIHLALSMVPSCLS